MRILTSIVLIICFGNFNSDKTRSNHLIGTWEFVKEVDKRTINEQKQNNCIANYKQIRTDNGTGRAEITYNANGDYKAYFTSDNIVYGKWILKDDNLTLNPIICKTENYNIEKTTLLRNHNLILKEDDKYYYLSPNIIKIKSLTNNRLKFEMSDGYSVFKKINK